MGLTSEQERQRRLTAGRVRDDSGPNGYWGRKEAGKKNWKHYADLGLLADLKPEGAANRRRQRNAAWAAYKRSVDRDIAGGVI